MSGGSLGYWPIASGDLNRDGIDDLIMGQRDPMIGGFSQAGAADVILGRNGFAPGSSFNLNSGEYDFRVHGSAARDMIGTWVASADTDGDGFDELLGGSSFFNDDKGAVWVINVVWASTTSVADWELFR